MILFITPSQNSILNFQGFTFSITKPPMSTTVDKISGEDPKKPKLRKAFNLLKSHASKVANFTLQWQDLEDYLRSIDDSIQTKIDQLQKSNPTHLNSAKTQSHSAKTQVNSIETQIKSKPFTSPEALNFNGVIVRDGKGLLFYINEHLKEKELSSSSSSRDFIIDELRSCKATGRLVIEAMRWFYPSDSSRGSIKLELSAVRRSCVALLGEMTKARPVIGDEVKEEAVRVALEWKKMVRREVGNSLELWAFLNFVGAFGLVGEFDKNEIFELFGSVSVRKQAPELFRSLGFADRVSEFIQKLVSQNMRLEAIKFIHAFDQLDKFPPMPLLKAHLKFAKKVENISCKKGQDTSQTQIDAIHKEVVSLRATIRCIENYNLQVEPEFSPESLRNRIDQLKMQKSVRNVTQAPRGPQAHRQHWSGKKRTTPDVKAQPNQKNTNKFYRIDPSSAAQNSSFRGLAAGHSIQPSYLRPVGLIESRSAEYLTPSAGMPRQAVDVHAPNTSHGTTSSFNSLRASQYQQTGSFKGEGAEYAARYYELGHANPNAHNNISARRYSLSDSSPIITHHTSSTVSSSNAHSRLTAQHMDAKTAYELGSSTSVRGVLSPLSQRYGTTSILTLNGRNVQFGSARSPQPVRLTSGILHSPTAHVSADSLRMPINNDRPVPSSSGYVTHNSQYKPSIYHL